MLNMAVKAARKAGSIIIRASLDLDALTIRRKQPERLRLRGRPRGRGGDHLDAARRLSRPRFLAEESGYKDNARPTTCGSSTRSTAPPTSCTAFRTTASPSRCRTRARPAGGGLRPDATTSSPPPGRGRVPQRPAHPRVASRTSSTDSLIGTGFPFRESANFDDYLRMLKNVMQVSSGVRRPGAAALDLAWVAAGASTASGRSGSRRGTWRRARSSSARPAASWATSRATTSTSTADALPPANGKLFGAFLKLLSARPSAIASARLRHVRTRRRRRGRRRHGRRYLRPRAQGGHGHPLLPPCSSPTRARSPRRSRRTRHQGEPVARERREEWRSALITQSRARSLRGRRGRDRRRRRWRSCTASSQLAPSPPALLCATASRPSSSRPHRPLRSPTRLSLLRARLQHAARARRRGAAFLRRPARLPKRSGPASRSRPPTSRGSPR